MPRHKHNLVPEGHTAYATAWKDNLLFYEYFHGDNGAGQGAMHQTGWTALVADLLLDPPRRTRRMIFYDDKTARTRAESPIAAGPAG